MSALMISIIWGIMDRWKLKNGNPGYPDWTCEKKRAVLFAGNSNITINF